MNIFRIIALSFLTVGAITLVGCSKGEVSTELGTGGAEPGSGEVAQTGISKEEVEAFAQKLETVVLERDNKAFVEMFKGGTKPIHGGAVTFTQCCYTWI